MKDTFLSDQSLCPSFIAGGKAFQSGVVVGDNPYPDDTEDHWHWMFGWAKAGVEVFKKNGKHRRSYSGGQQGDAMTETNATRAAGSSAPACSPLPSSEDRNEILTFADGSEMEINAQMRRDCGEAYSHACAAAVSRRMATPRLTEPNKEADEAQCQCDEPRTIWNESRRQWICGECGKPVNDKAEGAT